MARVCVAGAGVIGSLFAAHLARVAEVSALVRREEHAEALRTRGLRVSGRADFTAQLAAATSPDDLETPELVILAALHLLFVNRVRLGRIYAAGQRIADLERFAALKKEVMEETEKPETNERGVAEKTEAI